MRRSPFLALGVSAALLLGACTNSGDQATVIAFGDDGTTTSTEDLRLEYTEFPELSAVEDALCEWIDRTNRQTAQISERGRAVDSNFAGWLEQNTLADPVREGTERDYRVSLNALQIEGYAAIASGSGLALNADQVAHLQAAQPLVDALTGFNEELTSPTDLLELQDSKMIDRVTEKQRSAIPPLVADLDAEIVMFNDWAWDNCSQGGIKMVWDDFLPHDDLG